MGMESGIGMVIEIGIGIRLGKRLWWDGDLDED